MPSDIPEKPRANSALLMTDEQVHEIREQLKALIGTEGLRPTEIAREAGMAYGTLSVWLTGKYAGRNDRVAYDVKRWLDTRESSKMVARVIPRGPTFVYTKTAGEVLGLLNHAQHMPDIAAFVGAPGIGKTSAACHYAAKNSSVWKITANPSLSSPRDVLRDLARVLNLYARTVPAELQRVISDRVRGTRGLIIVDEANHLSPEALDQLRAIHDEADIGLALLGNEAVYATLEGNGRREKFAQLTSRVGMRKRRLRAHSDDIEAMLDAWNVEGEAERQLLRAIARKPGALRLMAKTMRMAHMVVSTTHEAITAGIIREAFKHVSTESVALQGEEAA